MSLTLFLRFFYLKKYFYLLYLRHRLKSVVSSSSISLEKSSIKTLVGLSLQDTDGSSWLANSRSSGYFSQPPSMRSVTGCSNRPWRVSCRPSTSCTMTFLNVRLVWVWLFRRDHDPEEALVLCKREK